MNMLLIRFSELYQRHLCRHSQYGINVVHLAAVIGSYYAVFSILTWLIDSPWLLLALVQPYFLVLAINVPLRLLAACVLFVAGFFALFFSFPPLPLWLCPFVLVAAHLVQNGSHKVWDIERDMSAFQATYRKGLSLKLLLAFYELPLLLNYLVFDRKSWAADISPAATPSGASEAP